MHQDFLRKILLEKKIVVCCGSGGVGKTTTSAALALEAARLGRKTLVLTIDPAKRLANSLGLEALGNNISKVDEKLLRKSGLSGDLYAMMLDCKRTFDELVERYAPTAEMARSILENRYYQHLSTAMTGSHEYMAMEKLYEIHEKGEFDLLVLDTPPTHNALDFLEAPNQMANVLDDSILKWFLKPYFVAGKFSFKTAQKGSKLVFHILEKITGIQVLQDISEFFLSFSGMYSGFKMRAERVRALLKEEQTAFVLITSPNRLTIEECIFFAKKLGEYALPVGGVIVNKVHEDFGVSTEQNTEVLIKQRSGLFNPEDHLLVKKLAENLRHFQILAEIDREAIGYLQAQTRSQADTIKQVRYFDKDIYALDDLKRMLEELFGIEKSDSVYEAAHI